MARVLTYLDANFPFWDGFPLFPHLSHDDGEKLDISFVSKNKSEESNLGEKNMSRICAEKGYWQYS